MISSINMPEDSLGRPGSDWHLGRRITALLNHFLWHYSSPPPLPQALCWSLPCTAKGSGLWTVTKRNFWGRSQQTSQVCIWVNPTVCSEELCHQAFSVICVIAKWVAGILQDGRCPQANASNSISIIKLTGGRTNLLHKFLIKYHCTIN